MPDEIGPESRFAQDGRSLKSSIKAGNGTDLCSWHKSQRRRVSKMQLLRGGSTLGPAYLISDKSILHYVWISVVYMEIDVD
jgi:hypothetical protein